MVQIISLTLPILISGLVLILVLKRNDIKFLDVPLDHHFKFNGIRLFGDNKTYRGLLVFIIVSIAVSVVLRMGYQNAYFQIIHPVFNNNPIIIGTIYSLAYTFGELINSAVKRQLHIAPGKTTRSSLRSLQKLVDLSDGIIMVAFTLAIFSLVATYQAISAAIIGIGIHLATDKFMQNLDLKKDL